MRTIAYQNVIDLLLDAVCIVDADSRIVFVSAAFERIFGYTPNEAVGLRMLDLVHPQDLARTRQQAQDIMAGALQLNFENRYVRKDGRIAHIRWTARCVHEDQLRVA
ncbi:PAS domain-containing protein, partial [Stenotrophomonas sp. YIM B06876]|uniref:PAS domain-containing protein n=1 Tax=Stenotrophomonas sp. YIM B06876 TaxID=3060211 RepID=UPI002738D51D